MKSMKGVIKCNEYGKKTMQACKIWTQTKLNKADHLQTIS